MKITSKPMQRVYTNDDRYIFSFLRKDGSNEVLVIVNLSHIELAAAKLNDEISGEYKNIFSDQVVEFSADTSFHMQPWTYLVFEKI